MAEQEEEKEKGEGEEKEKDQEESDSDSDSEAAEEVVVKPPPNCARSHELHVGCEFNSVDDSGSSSVSDEQSLTTWVCNRCERTFFDCLRRWHCNLCPPPSFDVCLECHPEPSEAQNPTAPSASPLVQSTECNICWDEMADPQTLYCGHRYCRECLVSSIATSISEGNVLALKCPDSNCRQTIADDQLSSLLSLNPELMGRYQQYLFVARARGDPHNYRMCPNIDCNRPYPTVMPQCPFCQTARCTSCPEAVHEGSCKDNYKRLRRQRRQKKGTLGQRFQDKRSKMWISMRTKPCPKCKTPIQKNKGCKHMSCRNCGHHFCWSCHGDWNRVGGYGHNCFMRAHGTPGQVIGKVTKDAGLILVGAPVVVIGGAIAAVAVIAAVPVLVIVGLAT